LLKELILEFIILALSYWLFQEKNINFSLQPNKKFLIRKYVDIIGFNQEKIKKIKP